MKDQNNTKTKRRVCLLSLIVLSSLYFYSSNESKPSQGEVAGFAQEQSRSEQKKLSSKDEDSSSLTTDSKILATKTKRKAQGKVISTSRVGSGIGEIGLTEEGGGIGPTSFSVTDEGLVLVMDRMNDRILSGVDGNLDTLVDLKGKFLKGMTMDDSDNLRVLTGNDTLVLESFTQDGEKLEGVNPTFKPVHLNGMDVRKVGDNLLISGAVENYSVNAEGVINEVPGIPLKSDLALEKAAFLETSASEQGDAVVLTFRNEESAPVAQREIKGDFGGILGTFPTESGNTVIAVESMGDNPSISFITVNAKGEVLDHLEVADKGDFLVDQKTQVSKDGCKAFQMSAEKEKVEVIEYELKCM